MKIQKKQIPGPYPPKLTNAGESLANLLEENGKPVLTQFNFFQIVWRMSLESSRKKSYFPHGPPSRDDYARLRLNLKKAGVIGADPDYGKRVIRMLTVPDLPAENIVCLADPTCYVSHLSAMQRWGLTDRSPDALMLTRPDRKTAAAQLRDYRTEALGEDEANPSFPSTIISHPARVRRRAIQMYESKTAGKFLKIRGEEARISTIGQTFLDMLQRPDLCGGMPHTLNVWEEHAETYFEEVVAAVDSASSGIVKSRAGYILEEHLRPGLTNPRIDSWRSFAQRGGSRRLDPAKDYAATYSERWMISLNV